MERFLQRDQPGSASRRSFGSTDVDFNDVFGGPPRRGSVQDWRCSESGDCAAAVGYRDPWSGLSEKPVFGEESLSRRRRQTSEFYDDIFRGDGSLDSNSTPKKVGSDVFSSTPPSRVLSPARPLPPQPPQPDALIGSSLPSAFCLQGKLGKEIDFSSSASPYRSPQKNKTSDLVGHGSPSLSSSFTSRSSIHVFPGEDGLRNDSRPFYRQSSLSREFSFNSILSPKSNLLEESDREGLRKKKSVLSGNDGGNQFHFSIYKWASKGVPIAMLLHGRNGSRAKGSAKVMNAGTEEPALCSQDIDLSSVGENNLEENESYKLSRELQSTSSVVGAKNKEELIHLKMTRKF
ncbi:hypothetical protein Syun_015716 [Stephania yunnanensis]|uniref:Uncharacterized protein n=1 Tax=Stephania yunnanensis TaxID=152371 RepID=A0AAP0JLQ0_9MAGN